MLLLFVLICVNPTVSMATTHMTKADGKAVIEKAVIAHKKTVSFPSTSSGRVMLESTLLKWMKKVNSLSSAAKLSKMPRVCRWKYMYGFSYISKYRWKTAVVNGKQVHILTKIELKYEASKKIVTKTLSAAKKIAKKAKRRYKTPYRRIKYAHDYLIKTITYDYAAVETGNYGYQPYSALVRYKAVCSGYTRAFYIVMQYIGVPARAVEAGTHTWNIVKIKDDWYHIDLTWDDLSDKLTHTYFLKSDTFMAQSHQGWTRIKKCPKNYAL